MKNWQRKYIKNNKRRLATDTLLNDDLYAELETQGVLSKIEIQGLKAKRDREGPRAEAYAFYDIVMTRDRAFEILIEVSPTVDLGDIGRILIEGRNEHAPTVTSTQYEFKSAVTASADIPSKKPRVQKSSASPQSPSSQQHVKSGLVSKIFNWCVVVIFGDQLANAYLKEVNQKKELTIKFDPPTAKMQKFLKSKDYYKLHEKTKLALIVNIKDFPKNKKEKQRYGSENDTNYMRDIWRHFGYTIFMEKEIDEKEKDGGNYTKEELIGFIEKLQKACNTIYETLQKPVSIVVFIGSHGAHDIIYTSKHERVNLYPDIINKFNDAVCEGVKDQPKIFLINTCQEVPDAAKKDHAFPPGVQARDGKVSKVEETDSTFSEVENRDGPFPGSSVRHRFVATAQATGFSAFRNPKMGSWFAHCLSFVMMKCAKDKNLNEMFGITSDLLQALERDECKVVFDYPQVPETTTTGMKDLYFITDSVANDIPIKILKGIFCLFLIIIFTIYITLYTPIHMGAVINKGSEL